jgi:hypothetical protein
MIVVRAPAEPVNLECGGHPMVALGDDIPAGLELDAGHAAGTPVGKRYASESGLELLCTKAGAGSLSIDGEPVPLKDAKPLPSSD